MIFTKIQGRDCYVQSHPVKSFLSGPKMRFSAAIRILLLSIMVLGALSSFTSSIATNNQFYHPLIQQLRHHQEETNPVSTPDNPETKLTPPTIWLLQVIKSSVYVLIFATLIVFCPALIQDLAAMRPLRLCFCYKKIFALFSTSKEISVLKYMTSHPKIEKGCEYYIG